VTSGLTLNTNDIIRVMTGTGAGWGNPLERPVEKVIEDVRNEYITPAIAEKSYGVIVDPKTLQVLGFTNGRKQ
jgi:N-methylhydantoinase B